jgi:hypothetical protein
LLLLRLSISDDGVHLTDFDPLYLLLTFLFFVMVGASGGRWPATGQARFSSRTLALVSIGIWIVSADLVGGVVAYGPVVTFLLLGSRAGNREPAVD